jgi:diguanylate cyclase (GGDEF)-like protein
LILVVDDNRANRDLLVALLDSVGHESMVAQNGEEALTLIAEHHPKLVITDILMPEMDGFQLVLHIRTSSALPQPQVIFLTATYIEAEARELAEACGVKHFFTKPVEPATLLRIVDQIHAEPPPEDRNVGIWNGELISKYFRLISRKLYQHVEELDELVALKTHQLRNTNTLLEKEMSDRRQIEKDLHEANRRLNEEAIRDPLTGVFNRRYMKTVLQREIAKCQRHSCGLAALIIDIDHFKRCNDKYGHLAGDTILCAVANHILSQVRLEDMLSRFGGEEFVLVVPDATQEGAFILGDKLRYGIERLHLDFNGRRMDPITISVGIAMFSPAYKTEEDLLHAADAALYRAKEAGRNRVIMA